MWRLMLRRSLLAALMLAAVALVACNSAGEDEGPATSVPGQPSAAPTPDLVEERIDALLDGPQPSYGELNRQQMRRMITVADDGPFYMVNFIKFRELALYPDGRDADLTGREANARYTVLPILLDIGARPVFVADVERQLIGDSTTWDQVGVVLYPSRAAFLAMIERPDFRSIAIHKNAGVEKSIVLVTEPIDLGGVPPSIDPNALPYPATATDSAFMMVHLMEFRKRAEYADGRETDLTGRQAVERYEQSRVEGAVPLGIRPVTWLAVEGVLVGDGREWEEVRLNRFPSHATFAALAAQPSALEDRAAGLEDTYALMTAPIFVDDLTPQ